MGKARHQGRHIAAHRRHAGSMWRHYCGGGIGTRGLVISKSMSAVYQVHLTGDYKESQMAGAGRSLSRSSIVNYQISAKGGKGYR